MHAKHNKTKTKNEHTISIRIEPYPRVALGAAQRPIHMTGENGWERTQ
jgi:hypothetical protein